MTTLGTDPPEKIADLAEACVRFVQKTIGVAPDYTQETLSLVDHYMRSIPEEPEDEVLALLVPACGAYFGEVVRRELGAIWTCPDDEYASWSLELRGSGVQLNPVGVALEVATGEDAEGWSANIRVPPPDRDRVKEAVDRLGEVPEDDYYTFVVRYEVLVCAHQELLPKKEPDHTLN